jgi:hypothetical protein
MDFYMHMNYVPTSVNKMFPLYMKVLFHFKNHQIFLAHHTHKDSSLLGCDAVLQGK